MDIVTFAGTGRRVVAWPSYVVPMPFVGVATCEQQGQQRDLRPRASQILPTTDPQRPSAPSRWVT
ncbi:hypothetical protein GCM10023200_34290 [Actinomycetospora chlora]|jgi:hypothetical protein|uniref:Uncharacterized protein n=1 Tax=Actinomycetospora chlora TaxID=663608 RepID=A0ABP9BJW6_9PSEU